MGAITREQLAGELIQQALDNGGELGVAVLEKACRDFLDKSKLKGMRTLVATPTHHYSSYHSRKEV